MVKIQSSALPSDRSSCYVPSFYKAGSEFHLRSCCYPGIWQCELRLRPDDDLRNAKLSREAVDRERKAPLPCAVSDTRAVELVCSFL